MFRAIFTNTSGIALSRILGFIRDLLTASALGASVYSDIFFVAFKLPNLFRRIFAEGAFTQVFMPAFIKTAKKAHFSATIFMQLFATILLLTLLVQLFPKVATYLIAVGFNAPTIALAAPFVALNFWYLALIFCVTFLASLLQYKHHFATTAFSTALLNSAIIIALLLSMHGSDATIVYAMSVGVIIGGVLQLIAHLLQIWKLRLHRLLIGGIKRLFNSKQRNQQPPFYKEFGFAIWGNSTAQLAAFLDTWLASFLVTGSISYLYYANRIFQLPLALFAIATSVALFPRIAKAMKQHNQPQALALLHQGFWLLTLLLFSATAIGMVFSQEIIVLLFERGAFTHSDSLQSAFILQMYLIALLPFGLSKLLQLWIFAQQNQRLSAKIATISLSTNLILSLLFMYYLGAAGLALSSSIAGIVTFILTLKSFKKEELLVILSHKYSSLFLLGAALFIALLILSKDFFHAAL